MVELIDLAKRRAPVWYTIKIGHHWDDRLEVIVEDVADDNRSKLAVADALQRISGLQVPADALHAELLAQINSLVDSYEPDDLSKLSRLADIVSNYEKVRYPINDEFI